MKDLTKHVGVKMVDATLIDNELAHYQKMLTAEGERSDRLEVYWKGKIECLQWVKEQLCSVAPHIEQAWQMAQDTEITPESNDGGDTWNDTYRTKLSLEEYLQKVYGEEASVPA